MKVLHVISGLGTGGAEMMLLKLLSASPAGFDHRVIALAASGPIGERIRELGVSVSVVDLKSGPSAWFGLPRAVYSALRWRPDLIQGWMYHGNLAAFVIALLSARLSRLTWNIRHSLYALKYEKRLTRIVIKAGAWVSRYPQLIIYNSEVSRRQHVAAGFDDRHGATIANGFDTDRFRPDAARRTATRRALQINTDTAVVGMVARFHPMKDHATFLRACAQVAAQHPDSHFVVVGRGCDAENRELRDLVTDLGIDEKVSLLGERAALEELYPAMDACCLTSAWGEGFPNVIGEAMSCEVFCVASAVGDSGFVIDDFGAVVPPRRPDLIAEAILGYFELDPERREKIQAGARQRIVTQFGIRAIAADYFRRYALLADQQAADGSASS